MWPAFTYAGAQAWTGSTDADEHDGVHPTRWEAQCFGAFASEHFGIRDGGGFTQMWDQLGSCTLPLKAFETACFVDDDGLTQARALARRMGGAVVGKRATLQQVRNQMFDLKSQVTRNPEDWAAIEHSADIVQFALDRLQAFTSDPPANTDWKSRAKQILAGIEADWNRNRYAGDPNLQGTYVPGQNVAWRFRQLAE
jgi:hypothetical protein